MAYEKRQVVYWVADNFGKGWASECDVAFSNSPISCFIATENKKIIGFACYDATAKNFFGHMSIAKEARNRGIGKALLLSYLHAMYANGYAHAIVGRADVPGFYEKTIEAIEIPGSSSGI